MDKTLQERVDFGLNVARKLVAETDKKLISAIRNEDWGTAHELQHFISGMSQVIAIFEHATE